jgi:hypothetical protein
LNGLFFRNSSLAFLLFVPRGTRAIGSVALNGVLPKGQNRETPSQRFAADFPVSRGQNCPSHLSSK